MSQISMDHLPKVLEMALAELFGEQQLVQYNINSNGNITSVSMKFTMPGHVVHTPVSQSKLGILLSFHHRQVYYY